MQIESNLAINDLKPFRKFFEILREIASNFYVPTDKILVLIM